MFLLVLTLSWFGDLGGSRLAGVGGSGLVYGSHPKHVLLALGEPGLGEEPPWSVGLADLVPGLPGLGQLHLDDVVGDLCAAVLGGLVPLEVHAVRVPVDEPDIPWRVGSICESQSKLKPRSNY